MSEVDLNEEYDDLAGIDVNEYTSKTSYGIFNDSAVWNPKFESNGGPIPDAMKEVILDTPLYEDVDAERALRHALLTNEDRERNGTLQRDGMVLIKRQVTLKSPWILDISDTGEWIEDRPSPQVNSDSP